MDISLSGENAFQSYIEWNSITLRGPTHGIVTQTRQKSASGV